MSFKNIFYDTRKSQIHLWESNNYEVIHWVPYMFVISNVGEYRTIDGKQVAKLEFDSYNEYYSYQNKTHFFENGVKPEIQFLAEKYHTIPDEHLETPILTIYTLDIEVKHDKSFPDVLDPKDPITLISLRDKTKGITYTFGIKPYTGTYKNVKFVYCRNEEELLRKFFGFLKVNPCDVLTGWNILGYISMTKTQGFDIPYIINRTKRIFGEDTVIYKHFSPIGVVRTWQSHDGVMNVDIGGVSIIDYMDIYKWYSPIKLEAYTLDYVSKYELDKGKLDYSEYNDLNELFEKDWNKYVEYNMTDVYRVDQLEDKLGYIRLIQSLSLLTKCPMKYYHAMTQLLEGLMLTYYRRNSLVAPTFFGGTQESYEAAYVKEPQVGKHKWVVDLDIKSSYPTAIISLNMSLETYYGRIIELSEDQVIRYTRNKNFPPFVILKSTGKNKIEGKKLDVFNEALKKKMLCIAPCGSVFYNKPTGVMANVERNLFVKRQEVKKMMVTQEKNLDRLHETKKEKAKYEIERLFSFQWALKIVLNAMFGITSVPYSRYFNTHISEAITSCGRYTVKSGERFVNEYLNDGIYLIDSSFNPAPLSLINKVKQKRDYVAYMDTDSVFIMLEKFIYDVIEDKKTWDDLSKEEKISFIIRLSKSIEKYVNDRAFNEVQLQDYNSIVEDFKIEFEQEVVAQTALFVKKKKYAYWIVNEAGVPKDKMQVKGLEIVRSDGPEIVRDMLREIMEFILKDNSDQEITNKITENKNTLLNVLPEEIAANIGVNNIEKYLNEDKETYGKGTPWHVKATANYNRLLRLLKITDRYSEITDGTKIKVVYLKPNTLGLETVAFKRWPKEFDKIVEVDREKHISKYLIKKIQLLLEPMGKTSILTGNSSSKLLSLFE